MDASVPTLVLGFGAVLVNKAKYLIIMMLFMLVSALLSTKQFSEGVSWS